MSKDVAAILVMGGNGMRFGSEVPKQFHLLAGKKIYLHTLDRFLGFEQVIIVCHREWIEEVREDVAAYPNVKVIPGGKTRQKSSFLGLQACADGTKYVLVHDAVRPFVNAEVIAEHLAAVRIYGAVNTCIPSSDTLVHSKDGNTIDSIPKRQEYLRGQTPQSFEYERILKAHQENSGGNASDDCGLIKGPIHIVKGSEGNIKITTALDLLLASHLCTQLNR